MYHALKINDYATIELALAAIPAGVTSLNLSRNSLYLKTDAEWTEAFSSIPEGVTSLNLSSNGLRRKTAQELRAFLQAIPAHVKHIDLRSNYLFANKTREEIDVFLVELGDVRGRLDLSHNGESDFARAFGALIQLETREVLPRERRFNPPREIKASIASYLGPSEADAFEELTQGANAIYAQRALAINFFSSGNR